MYGRHPPALVGTPLILFVLLVMGVLTVGLAGLPFTTSITVPQTMQIGQTSYVVVNVENRWWGRTVTVLSVTMSIAGGNEFTLYASPLVVPANSRQGWLFSFDVPNGLPLGSQPYVVHVNLAQTQFLFFGEDTMTVIAPGSVMISP